MNRLCLLLIVTVVLLPATAVASLIGDRIDFERVNGPPIPTNPYLGINYDAVQELVIVGPEWVDANGYTVDVGDSSIELLNQTTLSFLQWTFGAGLSPAKWIWSDLEWVGEDGEIVGVSTSWSPNLVSNPESFTVTHDAHSVTLEVTGGVGVRIFRNGWFKIDLEVEHSTIPEPAPLALMGLGLAGIGYQRRMKPVS